MKHQIVIFLLSTLSILLHSLRLAAQDSLVENVKNLYSEKSKKNKPDTISYRNSYTSTIDSINEYKAENKFNYVYYLDSILRQRKIPVETVSSESFREISKKRSGQNLQANSKPINNILNNSLVRIILWALAFCFISYILYRLFLTGGIFKRDSLRQNREADEATEENIIAVSGFDKLIDEAADKKNFRLAIRYLYLQTLQKLFEMDLLNYSADKTNHQYVKELGSTQGHEEFSLLTLTYEYAWYGKFNISGESYSQIYKTFKQYHQKI